MPSGNPRTSPSYLEIYFRVNRFTRSGNHDQAPWPGLVAILAILARRAGFLFRDVFSGKHVVLADRHSFNAIYRPGDVVVAFSCSDAAGVPSWDGISTQQALFIKNLLASARLRCSAAVSC